MGFGVIGSVSHMVVGRVPVNRFQSRLPIRLFVSMCAAFAVSAVVMKSTDAALNGQTANPTNSIESGALSLTDNDAAAAILGVADMVPGQSKVGCLRITYTGPATNVTAVKLYGSSVPAGLAPSLSLTVATGSGTSLTCTDFALNATIYTNTLDQFLSAVSTFGTGVNVFTPSTVSEAITVKFTLTLSSSSPSSDQGKTADPLFVFEIRTT